MSLLVWCVLCVYVYVHVCVCFCGFSILFFNYICFNYPDCYLKAEKEGMELDGWGFREDLGQDAGGGNMIII